VVTCVQGGDVCAGWWGVQGGGVCRVVTCVQRGDVCAGW